MPPNVIWFIILLAIAGVLLAAELVVPSHGVLTVLALLALLATVGVAFSIGRWFGLGALLTLAVLGPALGAFVFKVWQRSPIGRRLVLHSVVENPPHPLVLVGSVGRTMGELRPMGECEFGEIRVRARSEMGDVIAGGAAVTLIELQSGVATVRLATQSQTT